MEIQVKFLECLPILVKIDLDIVTHEHGRKTNILGIYFLDAT